MRNVVRVERQKTSMGVLDNALLLETKETLTLPLASTLSSAPAAARNKPTVVRGRSLPRLLASVFPLLTPLFRRFFFVLYERQKQKTFDSFHDFICIQLQSRRHLRSHHRNDRPMRRREFDKQ
jgi:hypothetical protein